MNIHLILSQGLTNAVEHLFSAKVEPSQIQLQKTRKEFEGDLTIVIFPLVKISKMGPEQTGQAIGEYMVEHLPEVTSFNVVKGFLNLSISKEFWLELFKSMVATENFGFQPADTKPRVLVEYASPNTNKPLHLGHLRNIFLGFAVAKILKANGHSVSKVQIINDRGIHICKSMYAWKLLGNGETPHSSSLKGDKLVGKYYVEFDKLYKTQQAEMLAGGATAEDAAQNAPAMKEAQELLRKWEAKDQEVWDLWNMMNGWVYDGFETTYQTMGVDFDKNYYESETYLLGRDEVMNGLQKGIFFQKEDGSIWVDLTDQGLDQKALLRKDGTAMYITQDIGTAILRFRDYKDAAYQIYTVGNEQEYHFKVLFKILKKLGFEQGEKCYHLSYGMVELPEGKMKSREGTVVDADDIMEEMRAEAESVAKEQGKLEGLEEEEKADVYKAIGMSALKYFLLKVDPIKNMTFNPQESIDFNGNTGPFILYTYVRTNAIKTKFEASGEDYKSYGLEPNLISSIEQEIIKKMNDFPEVLLEAGEKYNPSLIANYCYELVREFNSFYHDFPILRESNDDLKKFRVSLTVKVGEIIKNCMDLLGVSVVKKM
jgi:arginyl-tRNA synthetase